MKAISDYDVMLAFAKEWYRVYKDRLFDGMVVEEDGTRRPIKAQEQNWYIIARREGEDE